MGRRRKASLWSKTGIRESRGKRLPGYYVRFYSYDLDGNRTHHSKNFATLRAAREWVRQYNARHDLGELGKVIPVSIAEAVHEFLAGCASLAPDTQTHYANALGMLGGQVGLEAAVCEIGSRDLDRFASRRLKVSKPATVQKHVRSLNRFFNWAIARGYAESNPISGMTSRPRGVRTRTRPAITNADLARIIEALDSEDRRIAVWLAATTGLDRGAITGLRAHQIDLEAGTITLRRQKTGVVVCVVIHPELLPALSARMRETSPSEALLQGLSRQAKGRDWWHQACTQAGRPEILFRDLRAFASSRLQRAGVSVADAQRMLGHSSPETTLRHYHSPDPAMIEAVGRLPLPGHPG